MNDFLDIQRDHASLINQCLKILSPGGLVFFSTNYSRFVLDASAIQASSIRDITRQTTPFDFEGKLKRWCYRIVK
jgi:23S rRNA (cytosine1962-C5)-methyltransferase